jgi:hypothetical protein
MVRVGCLISRGRDSDRGSGRVSVSGSDSKQRRGPARARHPDTATGRGVGHGPRRNGKPAAATGSASAAAISAGPRNGHGTRTRPPVTESDTDRGATENQRQRQGQRQRLRQRTAPSPVRSRHPGMAPGHGVGHGRGRTLVPRPHVTPSELASRGVPSELGLAVAATKVRSSRGACFGDSGRVSGSKPQCRGSPRTPPRHENHDLYGARDVAHRRACRRRLTPGTRRTGAGHPPVALRAKAERFSFSGARLPHARNGEARHSHQAGRRDARRWPRSPEQDESHTPSQGGEPERRRDQRRTRRQAGATENQVTRNASVRGPTPCRVTVSGLRDHTGPHADAVAAPVPVAVPVAVAVAGSPKRACDSRSAWYLGAPVGRGEHGLVSGAMGWFGTSPGLLLRITGLLSRSAAPPLQLASLRRPETRLPIDRQRSPQVASTAFLVAGTRFSVTRYPRIPCGLAATESRQAAREALSQPPALSGPRACDPHGKGLSPRPLA